uniref:Uncharacterized protein n=1 Tax=Lotus japonicus TaxID=34305 RepID=I3SA80_LOTJA|nr:unknown [Lotus japonicus]
MFPYLSTTSYWSVFKLLFIRDHFFPRTHFWAPPVLDNYIPFTLVLYLIFRVANHLTTSPHF